MATAGDARGAGPERAYCPHLPASGLVTLYHDEGHHLVRARRARVGDPVVLFDGGLGAGSNALAARAVSEALPGDAGPLELVSFERGWFSSRATSRLVLEGQYAETLEQALGLDPGTALAVRFDHTISRCISSISTGLL